MQYLFRYLILICMIGIVFYSTIAYTNYSIQELISNDFLSEYGIEFSTDEMNTHGEIKKIYYNIDNIELRTPQNFNNDKEYCYRAVLSKDYSPLFQIKSGRYFDRKDFFSNSRVAVIGSEVANELNYHKVDFKTYITIFNYDYLIIGIIKRYEYSYINTSIFYNLDSIPIYNGYLVLDSEEEHIIDLAVDNLLNAQIISSYSKRHSIESFVKIKHRLKKILLVSSLTAFILGLSRAFISFWDTRMKTSIKYFFGMRPSTIIKGNMLNSMVEILSGIFCLMVMCAIIDYFEAVPIALLYLSPSLLVSVGGEALLDYEYLLRNRKI